jgi:succinyl-CoA synthetase beta subunit
VAVLMGKVLQEEPVQAGAVSLLQELVKDPEVYQVLIDLVTRVVAEDKVQQAVNAMLIGASHKVRRPLTFTLTDTHKGKSRGRLLDPGLARLIA